jgi:hypothetical protein
MAEGERFDRFGRKQSLCLLGDVRSLIFKRRPIRLKPGIKVGNSGNSHKL